MGVKDPLYQLGHHQEGRAHGEQKREIGTAHVSIAEIADSRVSVPFYDDFAFARKLVDV